MLRSFFTLSLEIAEIQNRFYLDPPYTLSAKPILLVPLSQVEQLITEIGDTFKVPVAVPRHPFTLTFYRDGTPQPKYLGTSRSRTEAGDLQNAIPSASPDHGECSDNASPEVKSRFDAFRQKCADAVAASKKKSTVAKKTKPEDPLLPNTNWYAQLRRAQRYMGLRPKSGKVSAPDPSLSWADQENFRLDQLKKEHIVLDPFDANESAPHPFEKEPVIISIDVESYERNHDLITEIGVSTLDTLDLVDIPPGLHGRNWAVQIRSRHFRIRGRENLVNRDFCVGNPNSFYFGTSEFVELSDAPNKVDKCFEWPFSVQYKHPGSQESSHGGSANLDTKAPEDRAISTRFGGVTTGPTNSEQNYANKAAVASILEEIGDEDAIKHALDLNRSSSRDPEELQRGPKDRNVLLLGHDIISDLEYMKILGSKIFSSARGTYPAPAMELATGNDPDSAKTLASIVEALDTALLYRELKNEPQNRGLGSILEDLDLPSYGLHNAGNDARYTMEALLATAVQARLKDDEAQEGKGKENEPAASA